MPQGKIFGVEPDIDTSVAHSARVHDYWLGGTDNFAAVGDAVIQAYPGVVPVQRWRPVPEAEAGARSAMWRGVARKPPG